MTDRDFALNAARQANPRPAGTSGPDGEWSAAELLSQIEHKSETGKTLERHARTAGPSGPGRNRGWLLAAAAAALVVLMIGAVGIVLQRYGGTDVVAPTPTIPPAPTTLPSPTTAPPPTAAPPIDRTPLEVTALYNEAVAAGDWTALRALYADTAELEVSTAEETIVPRVPLVDHEPQTPHDWDGDGLVDGFDALIDDGARQHAVGTTTFVSCSQVDAVTAVCEEVWEGHAFQCPDVGATTWMLTIVEGRITTHILQLVPRPAPPVDFSLIEQYNEWVSDNRPELEAELFKDQFNFAITPDTVKTHRELVAEWQAQLPPQALQATVTWDGEMCGFQGPTSVGVGDTMKLTFANSTTAFAKIDIGYLTTGATVDDVRNHYGTSWVQSEGPDPSFLVSVDQFGSQGSNEGFFTGLVLLPGVEVVQDVSLTTPREHVVICSGNDTQDWTEEWGIGVSDATVTVTE